MAVYTTLGKELVNRTLPAELRNPEMELDNSTLEKVLQNAAATSPDAYRKLSKELMDLGREFSFTEGVTLKMSDFHPVVDTKKILDELEPLAAKINAMDISEREKNEALADLYSTAQKTVTDSTYEQGVKSGNMMALAVKAKARGSANQLAQLVSSPVYYSDNKGKPLPILIRHSFSQGLTPAEFYASTYGARSGVVSTKFCLSGDTLVRTVNNGSVCIGELQPYDLVVGCDKKGASQPAVVTAVCHVGKRMCFTYIFESKSGTQLRITGTTDHKIAVRTKNGFEIRKLGTLAPKNFEHAVVSEGLEIPSKMKVGDTFEQAGRNLAEKNLSEERMVQIAHRIPQCTTKSLLSFFRSLVKNRGSVTRKEESSSVIRIPVPLRILGEAMLDALRTHFGIMGHIDGTKKNCGRIIINEPKAVWLFQDRFYPSGVESNITEGYAYEFVGCEPAGTIDTYDIEVDNESHLFSLANGLVVGNSTREAGDLGKQFSVAAAGLIVTGDDCGTSSAIPVSIDDPDNEGSVLSRDTAGYPAGTPLTGKIVADIRNKKVANILVRSPLTCGQEKGICKICAGVRENGKFPNLRDHVGLQASSALAERIAQGSLNLKHSGGKKDKGASKYVGFKYINQFAQIPEAFPQRAAVSETDGVVTAIRPAPQGGEIVVVNGVEHYVSPDQTVQVKIGDKLESGDQVSSGLVNPEDIVRHKGLGDARLYYAQRMTQMFKDTGLKANRRNTEIVSRAVLDNVEITNPDGAGNFLPGEVTTYSSLAGSYEPREGSQSLALDKSVGKYLEKPTLHYTVGTRVTPSMVKRLKDFGEQEVVVNDDEPGFRPSMTRLRTAGVPGTTDWMAKLQGTYLKSTLMESAQMGESSPMHSENPVSSLAYGVDFGRSKGKDVTF